MRTAESEEESLIPPPELVVAMAVFTGLPLPVADVDVAVYYLGSGGVVGPVVEFVLSELFYVVPTQSFYGST